jgi:DNA polymerase-3 subunit gamma/tau
VLRPYLEKLCQEEGVAVEPAVLPLVVRAGAGSARDTLSVLDQLIAGAGADGVSYVRAVALLGVTDAALIDEMCDALAAGDGAAVYGTIDRVAEAGHDPRRFASDLLERLRDLIVLQQVPDAVAKGLIDAPADQLERMGAHAAQIGPATLSRFADIVHNGLTEMRGTTAPRLLLELISARMLLPGAEESTGALLQRLERMERRLGASGASEPVHSEPVRVEPVPKPAPPAAAAPPEQAAPEKPSAPPEQAAPPEPATEVHSAPEQRAVATATQAPGALDAAAVRRVWPEVMSTIGDKSKRAAAVVREAVVTDVDGNTLVLTFKHTVHASMLTTSPEILTDAVSRVLGGVWTIRCDVVAEDTPGRPATTPPRQSAGRPAGERQAGDRQTRERQPAGRPAGRRQAGAGQTGEAQDDDGWPVPARPGAASTVPDEAWPTPALPGGSATASATAAATPASSTRPSGTATATPRSPARPARGAATSTTTAPPRTPTRRQPLADSADEPPYDPDYDPPVRDPQHVGFDPGDEPLDDVVDEQTARQSSEEQALRLLAEALGAEKIE